MGSRTTAGGGWRRRAAVPVTRTHAAGPEVEMVATEVATLAAAVADPFGVSPEAWELIEGNLFGASLAPYLAFLYFLGMPESKCPPRALFGFKFLLVFVFGTIPCAIVAKLQYNEILANVDWLHGPAESLLTITNLFIVLGMREGLRELREANGGDGGAGGSGGRRSSVSSVGSALLGWSATATTTTLALVATAGAAAVGSGAEAAETVAASAPSIADVAAFFRHTEPGNALSLPTWVIHVSSLIEWLVAMGLIWEYADASGNKKYKGLTWGMVPCHASGIAACTFHLFYNDPVLNAVVATQAGLTVVGNCTVAVAAYQIAKEGGAVNMLPWEEGFVLPWGNTSEEGVEDVEAVASEATQGAASNEQTEVVAGAGATAAIGGPNGGLVGWEDLSSAWSADSDAVLVLKLAAVSTALSAVVKWGSLEVDFPFEPNVWLAFTLIFGPTFLNAAKWSQISKQEEEADAAASR